MAEKCRGGGSIGSVGVGVGGVLRPLNDWNPLLVEDVSPNVELSILQSGLKTPILGASKIPPMG